LHLGEFQLDRVDVREGNWWVILPPRGTLPKSWVSGPLKSFSAQAPVCVGAGAALTASKVKANSTFLMNQPLSRALSRTSPEGRDSWNHSVRFGWGF